MAESTLSLTIDDLKADIGHFLGYGRGATYSETAWTTPQTNDINVALRICLSQVYTPPPLSPGEAPHSWSFLRPYVTLTLASGESTVVLPDDFGGIDDPILVTSPATAARRFQMRTTNEGMVQSYHAAQPDTTGFPRMVAEQVVKGTTASGSTRSRLYFWPTADAAYTIGVSYKYLPDVLTGSYPYPPGGAEHAELFRASALAAAELQFDDAQGPRWQYFMQRLAASIAVDRKRKGNLIGYNGDDSDRRRGIYHGGRHWRDFDNPAVTYNGDPL